MRGQWSEKNWRLDGDALVLPNGWRIALADIRQWRSDLIQGCTNLTGQWAGWKVRQQWLIPPGGGIRTWRLSEHYVRHAARTEIWHRQDISRRQLALF
jgi:hypothetical protein